MPRLAIIVWLVTGVAVVALWFASRDLSDRRLPEGAPASPPATRKAFLPGPAVDGWRVVHQTSAHHMLVLDVETERVAEATQIAQQLTEPVKDRYTEVMVYVFRPGRRGGLPAARVQWSHTGGYETTRYDP